MRFRLWLLVTCCILPIGSGARADDPAAEKPPAPPVRVIYNVTDLVHEPADADVVSAVVPPTEVSGKASEARAGRRGGGNDAGQRTATLAERVDQLSRTIQENIEPATWRDAGG